MYSTLPLQVKICSLLVLSTSTLMDWVVRQICNFLVGLYFLELAKKLGVGAVYAGFGGVSFLSALFAYNFIVEMKGRSLEEIEMSLSPAAPGKRE